jgi:asparagine synthase (glutamine-hydrolysing)
MCGIAGWLFSEGDQPAIETLERMAQSIRHRGPDDHGFYRDPAAGVALAHRRLSIIDLSAASHQPMVDEARQVALVYNGELYNFRELRRELQGRGHQFHSSGDTEVVLRSYIEWGVGAFERFNGMFALALWDGASQTLHLARDAMGIKPLYYLPRTDGLFFASEVKAFLALPDFSAQLNESGLHQYLEFGYVFDEQATMLAGVKKLAAGHRLEVREGRVAVGAAFFSPPAPVLSDGRGEAERVGELGAVLEQVVDEHLIADVPVGLLLSGGLDSSVLAALAARRGPLLTISMGFGDSDVDERVHARQVAEHIGSRHVDVLISPQEIRDEVMAGAWVFDDLFADWGTLSTRLLYRRCREMGVKVVLVGEGADELFGGYDVFRVPERLGLWQQFRLYQKYAGRRYGRFFGDFHRIMDGYLAEGGGDAFHAVRLFESRRQLPNQYVMKVDKASMAESVEARTPYLDRRVAELAYRTPIEWLLRQGNNGQDENKYLLRALARRHGLIPEAISGRKKFGAPLAAGWMDDDSGFREFARNTLLDTGSLTRQLGLDRAMRAYFDEGRDGYCFPRALSIFRNLAWRLLLLELWGRNYLAPKAA